MPEDVLHEIFPENTPETLEKGIVEDTLSTDSVNIEITSESTIAERQKIKSLLKEVTEKTEEAEKILEILKSLSANGEIHKNILEEIAKNVEKSYEQIKTSKTLDTKLYNEIKKKQNDINSLLEQSRFYLVEGKEIKLSLVKIEKTLKQLYVTSDKYRGFIEIAKTDVIKLGKEITALKKKANQNADKISKILGQSISYLDKIKDNKNTSDSLISYIKKITVETQQKQKQLKELLESSKKFLEQVRENEVEVNTITNKIKKRDEYTLKWYEKLFNPGGIKEDIENINTKIKNNQLLIEEQLSHSTSNRLTKSLKDRLDKIESSRNFRKWGIILSVVFLTILSLIIIGIKLGWFGIHSDSLNFFAHIELIYPLIFLLVFFMLQYVRENKFYEEYYFKYISAYGLPAYFELLESKDEVRSVDFLESSIKSIYTNPSQAINDCSKDTAFDYVVDGIKGIFSNKNIDVSKILETFTEGDIQKMADIIKKFKG